jgi:hypothetical protein
MTAGQEMVFVWQRIQKKTREVGVKPTDPKNSYQIYVSKLWIDGIERVRGES